MKYIDGSLAAEKKKKRIFAMSYSSSHWLEAVTSAECSDSKRTISLAVLQKSIEGVLVPKVAKQSTGNTYQDINIPPSRSNTNRNLIYFNLFCSG